jgi:transposase
VHEVRQLFEKALGLVPPWKVNRSEFDLAQRRLDLFLDFERGARFACPECGAAGRPVHDTEDKVWRHLDFFQYQAYLHARVPRIRCEQDGVRQVEVPWARPGSGFSHLFEAFVMTLAAEMPVRAIADLLREHDTRIWRLVHFHIDRARAAEDFSGVRHLGVDETSQHRGQNYISLFCDLGRAKLLFATPGHGADTFARFREDLVAHRGDPGQLRELCMDMSPRYLAGANEHLPEIPITFDKYHLVQEMNWAVDLVRRSEQTRRSSVKRGRYLWLANPENLSSRQRSSLDQLAAEHVRTARAYRIKLAFQELFRCAPEDAEDYLRRWYAWAIRSRLEPVKAFARSIRWHWEGVLRWFTSRVNNGILEAIGSLIQAAKRRARGYRTAENFIAVAYLIVGRLDFTTHTR